ncbi:hypothetical protein [Methanosarcina sp.]|nr:hypothetical protein [Methanosarcina sp.]MDY9925085.1 hypothetical protein [Methanosarcina sp.]
MERDLNTNNSGKTALEKSILFEKMSKGENPEEKAFGGFFR